MIGVMASGRHVEGGRRDVMDLPSGERLMYEGTKHVAGNEWVVRRR